MTSEPSPDTLATLVEDVRRLAAGPGRTILGLTGAPGAGKSTLATVLADALGPDLVALAPMDGFHLDDAILHARGARGRKGAIDTFDDAGYAALLTRLRAQAPDEVVYAPRYDRDLETSIGSALPISPSVPLVVAEGNYLLAQTGAWPKARAALGEVWFLDLDPREREARLVERHVRHGEDPARPMSGRSGRTTTTQSRWSRSRTGQRASCGSERDGADEPAIDIPVDITSGGRPHVGLAIFRVVQGVGGTEDFPLPGRTDVARAADLGYASSTRAGVRRLPDGRRTAALVS